MSCNCHLSRKSTGTALKLVTCELAGKLKARSCAIFNPWKLNGIKLNKSSEEEKKHLYEKINSDKLSLIFLIHKTLA